VLPGCVVSVGWMCESMLHELRQVHRAARPYSVD
jgi:hypothetical protein